MGRLLTSYHQGGGRKQGRGNHMAFSTMHILIVAGGLTLRAQNNLA
jgi:hypothetical protein